MLTFWADSTEEGEASYRKTNDLGESDSVPLKVKESKDTIYCNPQNSVSFHA